MSEATTSAARERRLIRDRAVLIQRAVAAIQMAVHDLPPTDRSLALVTALNDENQKYRVSPSAGQPAPTVRSRSPSPASA